MPRRIGQRGHRRGQPPGGGRRSDGGGDRGAGEERDVERQLLVVLGGGDRARLCALDFIGDALRELIERGSDVLQAGLRGILKLGE